LNDDDAGERPKNKSRRTLSAKLMGQTGNRTEISSGFRRFVP
jgi:hypothetical protein